MNRESLSQITPYLVAIFVLGVGWTLALSPQVAKAQETQSAETPPDQTPPETAKVEPDLKMENFLQSCQDQKFRSEMWKFYCEAESEAKGFAAWDNWQKIGKISGGEAAWSLDPETNLANLNMPDNGMDKGALFWNIFHSAFYKSPLWREKKNREWGEAFCNAFRYFAEVNLIPGSPWLAAVNERMAAGVNLQNRTPNPDLILFYCGKDYKRFKKLWLERQSRNSESLDDFFTAQYSETYFLGVDLGPSKPTYPEGATTLQKHQAENAARQYLNSLDGKTIKVKGFVTDVGGRVRLGGLEGYAYNVRLRLSDPNISYLVVYTNDSLASDLKKGDIVSCAGTITIGYGINILASKLALEPPEPHTVKHNAANWEGKVVQGDVRNNVYFIHKGIRYYVEKWDYVTPFGLWGDSRMLKVKQAEIDALPEGHAIDSIAEMKRCLAQ